MTRPLDMAAPLCREHDPDLVPDLMAFIEHLKAENARLWGRIYAARTMLHAAEASGDWTAIEAAHKRLTGLEIEQWLEGKQWPSSTK